DGPRRARARQLLHRWRGLPQRLLLHARPRPDLLLPPRARDASELPPPGRPARDRQRGAVGGMYETDDDLRALRELLDASYARSGEHLRSIWGKDSRLDARRLCEELVGVQVLDLGTVTGRGEPRVSPVDGLFFRGHLW